MGEFLTLNNGDRLHLDEYGPTQAPSVLVCTHGLGGGGYFFSGLGKALSGNRRVICPDMPGSGFSPRGDQALSFERFADVVVQTIESRFPKTASEGTVALLGHSMGAIVALKVYARI